MYLDPIDHFFRDELGVPGYIRYVDDFLVFANDKSSLAEWLEARRERLERLRLLVHPRKTRIYPVKEGVPFLGFRLWPNSRRLLPASVKRARRRLARLARRHNSGDLDLQAVSRSVQAWIAHARHGDTRGLRRRLRTITQYVYDATAALLVKAAP